VEKYLVTQTNTDLQFGFHRFVADTPENRTAADSNHEKIVAVIDATEIPEWGKKNSENLQRMSQMFVPSK
jgi:hypothetical protein